MSTKSGKYSTAEKRWAGIGPYYAMFPVEFADSVIAKYTKPGDVVLDPFAGRATAVYSAAVHDRVGIGIELNPVGWVYGKAKLFPAKRSLVEKKLELISQLSCKYSKIASELPPFFHHCYAPHVRQFLVAARDQLKWRNSSTDCTLMALLLVNLHGKRNDSLSNQMRQTKSMAPDYAIRWWQEHDSVPPDIDPLTFVQKRIDWRYAKGTPDVCPSQIYYGDASILLAKIKTFLTAQGKSTVSLLLTSPPYCGVTNYHYDQWIRLWLLGGSPFPPSNLGKYRNRFSNRDEYALLLRQVFQNASKQLDDDAVVYIRTDGRKYTYDTTINILEEVFPNKKLRTIKRPFSQPTQTHLFGDKKQKAGECDLILEP